MSVKGRTEIMTVGDLIEELKKYDPTKIVTVSCGYDGCCCATDTASGVYEDNIKLYGNGEMVSVVNIWARGD